MQEASRLDLVEHELAATDEMEELYDGIVVRTYRQGDLRFGVIVCSEFNFYLEFASFVSRVRPRGVILCGVCAAVGHERRIGDVVVGTSSILVQGNLLVEEFTPSGNESCAKVAAHSSLWSNLPHFAHEGTFVQSPVLRGVTLDLIPGRCSAIDKESWFCLNSQKRLLQSLILPVVKGIVDTTSREFVDTALNRAVKVALMILQKV